MRRALLRIVGSKCWYCEQDDEAPHVEHFRPQSIYPALAYRWINLLLACATCNATFKRQRFPLGPDATQPEEDRQDPCALGDADDALLVNPSRDDPLEHLVFDEGRVIARSHRGAVTESTLGLNREWLIDARRIHLRYVHLLIHAMETARRIDDPRLAGYQQALEEMASDRSRFSAMVRTELAAAGYDFRAAS